MQLYDIIEIINIELHFFLLDWPVLASFSASDVLSDSALDLLDLVEGKEEFLSDRRVSFAGFLLAALDVEGKMVEEASG